MEYTFNLQRLMAKGKYLLAIRDNFESLLSKSVFSIVENQIKNDHVDVNIKNRIFGVVVECVQNICASDTLHSTEKNSILVLNKIENGHKIIVGTQLKEDRKERISDLLNVISHSTVEELKAKKLSILSSKTDLDEAMKENLAIIDMFSRSAGKVIYYFEQGSGNDNFLVIEIEISNS